MQPALPKVVVPSSLLGLLALPVAALVPTPVTDLSAAFSPAYLMFHSQRQVMLELRAAEIELEVWLEEAEEEDSAAAARQAQRDAWQKGAAGEAPSDAANIWLPCLSTR